MESHRTMCVCPAPLGLAKPSGQLWALSLHHNSGFPAGLGGIWCPEAKTRVLLPPGVPRPWSPAWSPCLLSAGS